MKIGDRIFVHGYIDEIRKDTVIVRNDGGYFGTIPSEVMGELPSAQPERKKGKWTANGDIHKECPFCGEDWDKYVFGEVWYTDELPKFCPNCGADMMEDT